MLALLANPSRRDDMRVPGPFRAPCSANRERRIAALFAFGLNETRPVGLTDIVLGALHHQIADGEYGGNDDRDGHGRMDVPFHSGAFSCERGDPKAAPRCRTEPTCPSSEP